MFDVSIKYWLIFYPLGGQRLNKRRRKAKAKAAEKVTIYKSKAQGLFAGREYVSDEDDDLGDWWLYWDWLLTKVEFEGKDVKALIEF